MTILLDPAWLAVFATLATVGLLLLAAWAARLPPEQESGASAVPLRHALRATPIRQLDPDAAGRPRPRAPSASPASR
ncbi:DUF6412 domain-containing protein [Nonomuraea longicatena]|uniref:Uncharacterized protein n=1 Tax=Nonomuraea longicatena TaxID=83682 RepID=A0ABN1R7S3_9ACTN